MLLEPEGEQDQFCAEQDDGRCRRAERLAGVDGGCREPSECGSAEETADMRRVADIGDGESDVEVGDAPGEPTGEVEREKTASPERLLYERAEEVQRDHVKSQVDEPRVQ